MAPATAALEHMEDGEKCVYCIWIELRAGRENWIKTFVFINGFKKEWIYFLLLFSLLQHIWIFFVHQYHRLAALSSLCE